MAFGDFVQGRVIEQIACLANRAIRHQWQVAISAPQHEVELDAALFRVVQHLIGRATRVVQLDHVRDIKVGNTPGADFTRFLQAFEGFDGFGQWVLARPVQQIKVDIVGVHPSQACFARGRDTAAAGIVRVDLADHEYLVALPGDGLPDDLFGSAVGVHLGGVDQGQALFDT